MGAGIHVRGWVPSCEEQSHCIDDQHSTGLTGSQLTELDVHYVARRELELMWRTQGGEEEGDEGGEDDLDAAAQLHAQQRGITGRPEHVPAHHLPPALLDIVLRARLAQDTLIPARSAQTAPSVLAVMDVRLNILSSAKDALWHLTRLQMDWPVEPVRIYVWDNRSSSKAQPLLLRNVFSEAGVR